MGFWGIFEGFLGALGIFYYKFLRNQGRNRCKTNVNFQLFNHCFVQNGTIHEKKLNLFFFAFAAAQYCGRKKVKLFDLSDGVSFWVIFITFFSCYLCNF
jgi:hypothetical protein